VSIDVALFEVALRNLFENAQRHAGAREGLGLRVVVGPDSVKVIDSGPGFPADFVLGEQHPASREGGGVGLGLEIADVVARLHGGRLELSPGAETGRVELHFEGE
jgi:two-component system osmolarity sensor histidine kinase EnvZ